MYLRKMVYGLPKATKQGHNTSQIRAKHHIYKVTIQNNSNKYTYFKVHLKRQDKSKIKYFKTRAEAQMFLDSLRINPYL